eukprot:1156108-Pelagomonas_calceolata.AAC.13
MVVEDVNFMKLPGWNRAALYPFSRARNDLQSVRELDQEYWRAAPDPTTTYLPNLKNAPSLACIQNTNLEMPTPKQATSPTIRAYQ